MTVYAVRYRYNDRTEQRLTARPVHRAWLAERLAAGDLLASGPFTGGETGALLIFRAASRDDLDAILARDPFAAEDVLADVEVREWEQVLGPWAALG
ncbi:MAG TPA: YciI family protein [Cellulomonas sp.]